MEFWLISVPLDKTSIASQEKLQRTLTKTNLASCCKFAIPDLKVGTLDNLLVVSDILSRLDTLTESVIKKTCQCMGEVMEMSSDKVSENALANSDDNAVQDSCPSPLKAYYKAMSVDLFNYMTKFQWDRAKYPTSLTLQSLAEIINKQVSQVEAELRSRLAAYKSLKFSLKVLEPKTEGGLQTRRLYDIVRREDLVESAYLTTLLVVVAKGDYRQWDSNYESLSPFVVPRSSRRLYEDGEGGVFSVVLFRRDAHDFRARAKLCNFIVREYNLESEEQQQRERQKLTVDNREQYIVFMQWLKVNLSEVFVAWIHLKALRVFVESVLRYGLPASFQAILLQPNRKSAKKVREELASLFMHLDPACMCSKTNMCFDIPGISQQEYFSYIYFQINTNMLDCCK